MNVLQQLRERTPWAMGPVPASRPSNLPGPARSRVLGPFDELLRFSGDVVGHAERLFREHGPLVAVVGGDLGKLPQLARWVLVQGPDLTREIVTSPRAFHKPPLTKQLAKRGEGLSEREQALARWGAGLFHVNGEEHREHRRVMMPAFHKKRIEASCADMLAITEQHLASWRPGCVRDLKQELMHLTLRIAAKCLLGEDVSNGAARSVGENIQRALQLIIRPSVFLLPVDVPGMPFHRFLDEVEETDRRMRAMIAAKRARGGDEADALSMLIQARDAEGSFLTDDHLIEHAGVMFIAGHETSSNALTWTLLLLSQHPRVAADLVDELDGVLHGAPPRPEQLAALPFLDAVIKETLRLMPPVPMNARVVAEETELAGHPLPVGTNVLMSIFHTHRRPEVFANPRRFDPYRWSSLSPGVYDFHPFGSGPRTCIGAPFAMMEMKLVLATLLQRFRPEFIPGTRVDRFVTITMSVNGRLPMKLERQDRRFHRGVGGMRGNVAEMVDLPG